MKTTTAVRFLLTSFFILFAIHSNAEEQVCRYCADAMALPPGAELEGRYHYAPDRQVDVLHIKIDVTPNFAKRTIKATTSIKAKVIAKPVEILNLNAVNLHVKEVRCDEAQVADFNSTRNALQIAFEEAVEPGKELTVHIDYTAEPIMGLYFRTPEMGYPKTDTHIWTQGETHEARHWFPCFDYPNERSSTEVICHVPKDMTVLSNGQRMGEEIDDAGLKAVRWLQEKPHVNYLICLVAGHLKKLEKQHRDVPLGFYTQPTLAKYAANSFEDTPAIMAYFEEEIGLPFPWLKYDQVTIRDFTAGGMENTTLTTLTHGTIFDKATEQLRTTRRLDAHEMAHQWFGDYVTCKDWSHLWLNEGFATFYTHLYEGHKFGEEAKLYGLYRDAQGILSRKNDNRPIVFNEYKNPMDQFDYRSYPKGSWVLHMLRSQLGEELFRKCIKAYLEQHALTSVVSDDLRQVIEDHSGRSMDRFFDQWLYHARHPDLKISYKWLAKDKLAKVTIQQTHKVTDDVMLFELPTKLRFVVDGENVDRDIVVSEVEEDFYVPLAAKPTIVRFDPHYTLLADIKFNKSDDLLLAQLKNEADTMGRVLAAKALGERKTDASAEALKKVLNEDPFYGVRQIAAGSLAKHETDNAYEILRESIANQEDARVRSNIVSTLTGRFHEDTPDLIADLIRTEDNPLIKGSAIRGLGKFNGEESRKGILEYLNSRSFRNQLADSAISAIDQQNDPAYKKQLMKTLRKNEQRFTTRGFGRGLETLAKISKTEKKKKDVREFLSGYVNHPKKGVRMSAMRGLGALGDPLAMPVLQSFTSSNDQQISRAASDAINKLRDMKPSAPREVIELRKEVAELKKSSEKLEKALEEIRDQLKAKNETPKADAASKTDADKKADAPEKE